MSLQIQESYRSELKNAYAEYLKHQNRDSFDSAVGDIARKIFKTLRGSRDKVVNAVKEEVGKILEEAAAKAKAEADAKAKAEADAKAKAEAAAKAKLESQNSMAIMRIPFHSYKGNITEDNLMKSFKGRYRLGDFKSLMSFSTRNEAVIAGRNLGETRLAKAEAEANANTVADTATEAGELTQKSKPELQLTNMQTAKQLAMIATLAIGAISFLRQKQPPECLGII